MPLLEEPQPIVAATAPGELGNSAQLHAPHIISSSAELIELADDWNRLASDIPFRRHEWLATWWRHFSTPRMQLQIVTARGADGTLHCAMPWYLDRSPWQGRVLRLLGSGIVCTDYVSLLAAPAQQRHCAAHLAEWLDGEFAGEWDAIDLDQVDPQDPALATLVASLRDRGHTIDERAGMHCWRIPLPETWEAFTARFSKRRRERVRSHMNKWFKSGKGTLTLARTPAEFARGWEILVDLHQRRRRSLGQPGCFATARFASFLAEAVSRLFDKGLVRLSWLECEGRPAAVELNFVGGTTVYGYQMGMDPDLADCEPGNLRIAGSLRQAIEDGFTGYDLLRGDEPYKATWQAEPRPLVRWRIVNRQFRARCRHQLWLGAESAKQLVKHARDRIAGDKHHTKPAEAPAPKDDHPQACQA